MIKLYQGKDSIQGRERKLTRHGKLTLKVNTELIDMDINSLSKSLNKSKNAANIANIKGIIEYLTKFKGKLNRNNKITLTWEYKDDILTCKPIDILDFGVYGVRMSDYFVLEKGAFVRVEYKDIKDIVAFELMKDDLGFDFKRIENDLGDIGPIHINSMDKLYELWADECKPYEDSLYLKVENSNYIDRGNNVILDYSQKYEYKIDKYYEVVEESCRRVMTQLLDSLLYDVSAGISYKICDVTRDGFTIYVEDEKHWSGLKKDLCKSVCIQCVGRKFEVKPKFKKW